MRLAPRLGSSANQLHCVHSRPPRSSVDAGSMAKDPMLEAPVSPPGSPAAHGEWPGSCGSIRWPGPAGSGEGILED